ncbi:MAG: O-antigen ligase family protein, partial [Bacteroidetes bacterium]|nr:O-antigen ligase family protein [Fibrella sp.]
MLLSIILLLPFFQVYIYFRYMILIYAFVMIWQGDDKQLIRYTKEPINKCMILFFVIGIFSALTSADLTRTLTPLTDLIFFYLLFLICSVAISRHLTSPLLPTIILWGLLSSVFIQTMQLYGVESFYIYDEESLNMNTGLAYTNEDRVVRYWGPFGNSLTFSSYLSIFGLFLFGYYHSSLRKRTRFLSYVVLSVALYGVMLTAGRTALVSMLVGLLFYAFVKNRRKAIVLSAILVVVGFALSALIEQLLSGTTLGMVSRFTNLGDDKSYRTETWVRALPVLLNNPLFGTGPGNLQTQIAPLIRSIIVNEKQAMDLPWGHVENTYLSVLY